MRRRWLRWLLWTVGAIVILIAAAYFVIESNWGRERALVAILDRANRALRGELRVEALQGSVFGDVTFRGVTLTLNGKTIFAADTVRAQYSVWQLVFGELDLDAVTVVRPRIRATQDASGWDLAKVVPERDPDKPRSAFTFTINRVAVIDGDVEIRPMDAVARRLQDLQLETDFDYAAGEYVMHVDRAAMRDPDADVTMQSFEGDVQIGDTGIAVDEMHAVTVGSDVSGEVAYASNGEFPRELRFDVTAARLALREVAAYVPALREYPADTRLTATTARGTLADFTSDWTLESSAGRGKGRVEGGQRNGTMALRGEADVAEFDPAAWLDNRRLQGRVTARGTFDAKWKTEAPAASMDLRFSATAPSVRMAGYEAAAVRTSGTFTRGTLDASVAGRAYGATVDGRGTWNQRSNSWSARGRFADVDLRRLPKTFEVPALASRLAGEATLSGDPGGFVAETTLAESTVEDATLAADTVARIEKRGDDLTYAARGAVSNLNPSRIAAALKDAPPALRDADGTINGRFDIAARGTTLDTLDGTATVDLNDSVVSGIAVETMNATATLVARRLTATARVRVNDLTNRAVRVGDAAEFVASGTADVDVNIEDIRTPIPLEMIAGRAAVTLDRAVIRGIPLTRVQVNADVARGLARITTLQAEGEALRVEATGQVAFAGNSQSDLTYSADVRDLAVFQPFVDKQLSGTAQVEGTMTGPVDAVTTTGTLSTQELVAGPVKALVANAKYTVQLPQFDVARVQADATATATFIEVGDTKLDRVETIIKYTNQEMDLDATIAQGRRSVRVAGLVVPHPDHREAHVRQLDLAVADMRWTLPAGREAVVQYGEKTLAVHGFELTNGSARLVIDGTLSPADGTTAGIDFTVENARVEDINGLLLSDRQMSGRIDATGRLTGSLQAPEVTADLKVTEGRMQDIAYNSLTGRVGYATNRLSLDVNLDGGAAGQLTAAGTMPLAFGESAEGAPPYDLRINSSALQIGLVQPVIPAVSDLAGTAQVDVRVTGSAEAPRLDGTIMLSETTFSVIETGVTYQQLNADLLLQGPALTVRQLTVVDSNGRPAKVEGGLTLEGFTPQGTFELRATTNEFLVLDNNLGQVTIDANLQASGTTAAPKITGSIEVERGRLELGTLLERFAAPGYKSTPAPVQNEATPAPVGPYGNSTVDVDLVIPDNVVIRGRGLRTGDTPIGLGDLNITLGGTLDVTKAPGGDPNVVGRIAVVRGTYDFQGRRFQIERDSSIQFRGELTDPTIDIRAEREISSVIARVRATGTLRKPAITLSSSPPLDQGDILSLIVFNQPMNELRTDERVNLAGRAGALAAGAIATPIADSVARALDLDVFEIRPSSEISAGGSIAIGRQLSDNLFVGFQQQFGAGEMSKLTFEYRLTEFLRLVTAFAQGSGDRQAMTSQAEAAGIDLFFVIRR